MPFPKNEPTKILGSAARFFAAGDVGARRHRRARRQIIDLFQWHCPQPNTGSRQAPQQHDHRHFALGDLESSATEFLDVIKRRIADDIADRLKRQWIFQEIEFAKSTSRNRQRTLEPIDLIETENGMSERPRRDEDGAPSARRIEDRTVESFLLEQTPRAPCGLDIVPVAVLGKNMRFQSPRALHREPSKAKRKNSDVDRQSRRREPSNYSAADNDRAAAHAADAR